MPHGRSDANGLGDRSNKPGRRAARRRIARTVFFALTGVCLIAASATYVSYRSDANALRAKALEIVGNRAAPAQRVLTLTSWIHRHLGTARNPEYFVLRGLRATPMQVLDKGGDCADKSRLLSATLRQIDIPATMALCFHHDTGLPTHTVVEAQLGPDRYMVTDPAYELYYPDDHGGYYGILDLRKHPERLVERVRYVQATTPRFRPLHWYDPFEASAVGMSTFNWRKNGLTKLVRDCLFLAIGPDVYRLPRPTVIEEPKLAVATMLLALAAVAFVLARVAARTPRQRDANHLVLLASANADRRSTLSESAPSVSPAGAPALPSKPAHGLSDPWHVRS